MISRDPLVIFILKVLTCKSKPHFFLIFKILIFHLISSLAETINKRIFNIFYHPKQIYNFTKAHLIESKAWAGLRTVSARVIENAEKTFVKPVPQELNVKSELRKPCVFVEQVYKLFQYTKDFDEQMLKDEIDTLIAGVSNYFDSCISQVYR